ncbi:MAG: type II secretion system F family protein [Phycisphaeraceae bacterium]|nr:type II secretion system F family protein [Phycisphaeraceae bacterium]MCB9847252.1 type II secretion system F family protein [Phycisphaeraceae bacterium]
MSQAAAKSTQFFYIAVNAAGAKKMGLRAAASEADLLGELNNDRLLLLHAYPMPGWIAARNTIPVKDQLALNEQLASLLNRGVPLTDALDVAASLVSTATKQRIEKMRSAVASGASFADACAQVGGFDDVTITVYRAAEKSGDLAIAAEGLATSFRRRMAVAGKVGTLLVYPVMVLSIGVIVGTIMLVFVIPQIGSAIKSFGAELPWYTAAVLWLGDALRNHWLPIVSVIVALAILLIVGRRQVAAGVSALVRKLPLFGPLVLASESARFFAVMAAMTRSGVTIADALSVASGVVSHPRLREQLHTLQVRLVEGGVFSNIIDRVEALPMATRRLLIAADRAGDLESAFGGLSEDLSAEVNKQSDRLLAILEPLLIVVIFVLVGGLIASIMIPLLTATSSFR